MSFFRTTSCQTIVSKIARTFKPPDSSWIVDCIEDIGWAIQAIGYHTSFVKKSTDPPYIKVKNHRGLIPCDVDRILLVESLTKVGYTYNGLNPDGTNATPPDDEDESCAKYEGIQLTLSSDISLSSIGETSPRTTKMNTTNLNNTYDIVGGYVITGFESGLIKLHYVGFNIDKEGYPLVIDDYEYKSALEYYCIGQMIHRGFRPLSGITYGDAEGKFERHRYRAENICKMMGIDEARRFGASLTRYAQGANFGANFYAGLEQQEYIDRS